MDENTPTQKLPFGILQHNLPRAASPSSSCSINEPNIEVCFGFNVVQLHSSTGELHYRVTHGVVILELIPRCAAAQAMLLGRVLPAEMFTATIIHRTVAVFDLCGKNKQQERRGAGKSESQKGKVAK